MTLLYQDSLLPNPSVVSLEGIRGGSDLFCLTDTGTGGPGSWQFPNGNEVPNSGSGVRQYRGSSYVALTYSNSGTFPSGLYRCMIPDSRDQEVTLHAGIYQNGEGNDFSKNNN